MSAETLARSFEPFFTTKPVGEGTGLGLSMVYGIVKQHGGPISARSALGKGTTMELCWPITDDDLPTYAEVRVAAGPAHRVGAGRVVLVADDEALVRMLAVRALNEEGYTAIAAEDGAAALEAMESGRVKPDLAVTDVIMPGLNGRQLHDAIVERWRGIPVLFISGHTGADSILQRLVPPGAPFLQKPFTPDALTKAVGELFLPGDQRSLRQAQKKPLERGWGAPLRQLPAKPRSVICLSCRTV